LEGQFDPKHFLTFQIALLELNNEVILQSNGWIWY
jgi:hypothetical protein